MKKQKGFTLIELLTFLIALSVIGIALGSLYVAVHFLIKFW